MVIARKIIHKRREDLQQEQPKKKKVKTIPQNPNIYVLVWTVI